MSTINVHELREAVNRLPGDAEIIVECVGGDQFGQKFEVHGALAIDTAADGPGLVVKVVPLTRQEEMVLVCAHCRKMICRSTTTERWRHVGEYSRRVRDRHQAEPLTVAAMRQVDGW